MNGLLMVNGETIHGLMRHAWVLSYWVNYESCIVAWVNVLGSMVKYHWLYHMERGVAHCAPAGIMNQQTRQVEIKAMNS